MHFKNRERKRETRRETKVGRWWGDGGMEG